MIFQELLSVCSIENVVKEIQEQFREVLIDKQLLLYQVNQLIQRMQAEDNYPTFDDLFCFMAVSKGGEKDSLYVGLYDVDEKDIAGGWEKYKINEVTDWGLSEDLALGITVFEPNLKKTVQTAL